MRTASSRSVRARQLLPAQASGCAIARRILTVRSMSRCVCRRFPPRLCIGTHEARAFTNPLAWSHGVRHLNAPSPDPRAGPRSGRAGRCRLAGRPLGLRPLHLPTVYDQGWGRLVRTLGYLPFWVLVGFGILRSSSTSSTQRSALLLMLAPTFSGALNELLKLLVRRERPGPNAGEYVFRAFTDRPFSTAGLGMPSGDTIVAFAAARSWPAPGRRLGYSGMRWLGPVPWVAC